MFTLLFSVPLVCAASLPAVAAAMTDDDQSRADIVVTGERASSPPVASQSSIDAATAAARVNATNVEDTLKYLPSLIVRKRHIGDTQAPVATRTSGLGASARSLIYADGALLSALIGNNNTIASPRWGIVSSEEIARIDVTYGPFSAADPGNAIGGVIAITTRLPETLEATLKAGVNVQDFTLYAVERKLPSYQMAGTIGDRFGPLALFASVDRVDSRGQPLGYATVVRPAPNAAGTRATGGFDDLNRAGVPIRVFGATGFEHQRQDRIKLKAALDLGHVRLSYVGALFLNDTVATSETFLTDATGQPAYAGAFNIGGRPYAIAASALSGGTYLSDTRHWSHAVKAEGEGAHLSWQAIVTRYDFDHDIQRIATTALPAAATGGAGTLTRLDGTGWVTLNARVAWKTDTNTATIGGHFDRFTLHSDRFVTTDWRTGAAGALNLRSAGRTRTAALWIEDSWQPLPALTVTLGGRYESWRAFDGVNFSSTPAISKIQPGRNADRFSPKAAVAWDLGEGWRARASYGRAWRFPTVGELYQVVTTPVPAVPNPDLRPERADSAELAIENADSHGAARVALFNEAIADALISQTGPLNGTTTLATFVQNVERTRARGVEAAVDRRDVLPRVDLAASLTYADAQTRADPVLPAAVGKLIPGVPHWKATLVVTWRPSDAVSLTAAGRYTSRLFGTLDNSDTVGNTYQGFDRYLVIDLRAQIRAGSRMTFGLGVDNVANQDYFLFHPFPQRSFSADVRWKL